MKTKFAVLLMASGLLVGGSALADDGLAIAKRNGCLACHAVDKKVIGPAWQDVADKYKGDKSAKDTLLTSMKNGSRGKWGNTPMPPQARVPDEEKAKLVDFVLSLAK